MAAPILEKSSLNEELKFMLVSFWIGNLWLSSSCYDSQIIAIAFLISFIFNDDLTCCKLNNLHSHNIS